MCDGDSKEYTSQNEGKLHHLLYVYLNKEAPYMI